MVERLVGTPSTGSDTSHAWRVEKYIRLGPVLVEYSYPMRGDTFLRVAIQRSALLLICLLACLGVSHAQEWHESTRGRAESRWQAAAPAPDGLPRVVSPSADVRPAIVDPAHGLPSVHWGTISDSDRGLESPTDQAWEQLLQRLEAAERRLGELEAVDPTIELIVPGGWLDPETGELRLPSDEEESDGPNGPSVNVTGQVQIDFFHFNQSERNKLAIGELENATGFRRARLGVLGKFTRRRSTASNDWG